MNPLRPQFMLCVTHASLRLGRISVRHLARVKKLLLSVLLSLMLIGGALFFYFSCLPVSAAKLERLKPGMTTNDVMMLFGKPQTIRDRTAEPPATNDLFWDMSLCWAYESYSHFFVVEIFFDREGRYSGHWKD